jgi:hypothetical protein
VKGTGVACGSHIAEETARGRHDALAIRHSVGRTVAVKTNVQSVAGRTRRLHPCRTCREADRQQNLAGASLPWPMLILRKRTACRWPRRTPHPALRPMTISTGNNEFSTTTNG